MSKFANAVVGAATLVLAGLPAIALTTTAHAAPSPYVVRVADLNLATVAGRQTFDARVDQAARDFCRNHVSTTGDRSGARKVCLTSVRAEADAKAAGVRQLAVATR